MLNSAQSENANFPQFLHILYIYHVIVLPSGLLGGKTLHKITAFTVV